MPLLTFEDIINAHDAVVVESSLLDVRDVLPVHRKAYFAGFDAALRQKKVVTHPLEHAYCQYYFAEGSRAEALGARVVPYRAFLWSKEYERFAFEVAVKIERMTRPGQVPLQDTGVIALALLYGSLVRTALLTSTHSTAKVAEQTAKHQGVRTRTFLRVNETGLFLDPDRRGVSAHDVKTFGFRR